MAYNFFDVALGIYMEYGERFFAGLSFPNLVKSRIDQSSIDTDTGNPAAGNFMALVGYRFDIENHDFMVEPSILIKSFDGAPFQADLNLKMSFIDEQLIGGLVYSFGNVSKVGILIGTRIDALTISYSYDIGLSDFQDYHNGGHEISVGYGLRWKVRNTTCRTRSELNLLQEISKDPVLVKHWVFYFRQDAASSGPVCTNCLKTL